MALSAVRKKPLLKETNVGAWDMALDPGEDIITGDDSGSKSLEEIVNEAIATMPEPSLADEISSAVETAANEASNMIREVSSGIGSAFDAASKLPGNMIDELTGVGSGLGKSMKALLKNCLGTGSIKGYGGKRYSNRGGGGGPCGPKAFGDMLAAASGDGMFKGVPGLDSAMNAFSALSNIGYNQGVCGTFGALRDANVFKNAGVVGSSIERLGGSIMGGMALAGNIKGFMDVGKNMSGMNPFSVSPGSIGNMFSNMKFPMDVKPGNLSYLSDAVPESMTSLDPNWLAPANNDHLKLTYSDGVSNDTSELFSNKICKPSYGSADLDIIPSSNETVVYSSLTKDSSMDIKDSKENGNNRTYYYSDGTTIPPVSSVKRDDYKDDESYSRAQRSEMKSNPKLMEYPYDSEEERLAAEEKRKRQLEKRRSSWF